LYKSRHFKGKHIQLDADLQKQEQNQNEDVQGSRNQSTMNSQASQPGGNNSFA